MPLNKKQQRAVNSIRKALNKAHVAGLSGGVYDGSFCIWPTKVHETVMGSGRQFFEIVHVHGEVMSEVIMHLDGGAGV